MPGAHRKTDARYCFGKTLVRNQSTVFVNDLLWAVEPDPCDHLQGDLRAVYGPRNVYIENLHVICAPGDHAVADLQHPPPATWPKTASDDTFVYQGGGGG